MDFMQPPEYRRNKVVRAFKIGWIVGNTIHPEQPCYAPVTVTSEVMAKRGIDKGGYFVTYGDGYQSFSPSDVFEAGYTKITDDQPTPYSS